MSKYYLSKLKLAMGAMLILSILFLSACSSKVNKTIVFADPDWDSIRFHNSVARFIIEKGYGYKTDVTVGTTPITFTALRKGDIDAYMEVWTDNLEFYDEAVKSGDVIEVSTNFDDNAQGLYVPTYVIKGDEKRGIKPVAPDLKTVKDLDKYKDVFKDPEESGKGRIYGAISGWQIDEILYKKYKAYGLDKNFNYMRPGSETALSASIASAYERGEPWVGYYWEPTWIMGKYDMTLLKDEKYDEKRWKDGVGEFPAVPVTICVNKEMEKKAPDAVDFLKNYKTNSEITSKALAYMLETKASHDDTAQWFLKENEDLWTKWVPEDIAKKVKESLK